MLLVEDPDFGAVNEARIVGVHPETHERRGNALKVAHHHGDRMRRNGEAWLISDVYLDGAISEVATRRSEFAAILKTEGVDGLIAALNRKADMLTRTMAKAY